MNTNNSRDSVIVDAVSKVNGLMDRLDLTFAERIGVAALIVWLIGREIGEDDVLAKFNEVLSFAREDGASGPCRLDALASELLRRN